MLCQVSQVWHNIISILGGWYKKHSKPLRVQPAVISLQFGSLVRAIHDVLTGYFPHIPYARAYTAAA